ncbi:MAG: hypothetical protein NTW52_13245 [Planctomycetota bacterium]|nr:hypothetical protein [Planctomycetota bacterium]
MSMTRFGFAFAVAFCVSVPFAQALERGKGGGGGRPGGSAGGKPPGGNWSESRQQPQGGHSEAGHGAAGAEAHRQTQPSGGNAAAGAAAERNNQSNASGKQGAAAGAAAMNRNQPNVSGAQGAAAGAAYENRNQPKASGAEGAAAGAAAMNRNQPNASGAQGAAAGAAYANRNQPSMSGAEGAAAGAAVANRNQPAMSGMAGAAAGYAAVRSSFDHSGLYGQDWYGAHPGTWAGAGWAAGTAWNQTGWNAVASYCGYVNSTPVTYNYGQNVTCLNGNVLVNGQTVGTAEEFSQQASEIADSGASAESTDSEKWLPIGVFAMVQNDQQHPHLIMQLAVNQAGNLRGNYTDNATDNTLPIQGGVDPNTQRACWTVGANSAAVIEAGLTNLTQGDAPALIHKNGKTERWTLVRLAQPQ